MFYLKLPIDFLLLALGSTNMEQSASNFYGFGDWVFLTSDASQHHTYCERDCCLLTWSASNKETNVLHNPWKGHSSVLTCRILHNFKLMVPVVIKCVPFPDSLTWFKLARIREGELWGCGKQCILFSCGRSKLQNWLIPISVGSCERHRERKSRKQKQVSSSGTAQTEDSSTGP